MKYCKHIGGIEYLVKISPKDKDFLEHQVSKLEKEDKLKHIDIHKFPLEEIIKKMKYSDDSGLIIYDKKNKEVRYLGIKKLERDNINYISDVLKQDNSIDAYLDKDGQIDIMKNLSEHNLPLYTYTKVKDDEFQLKFEISNQLGLHARPAALFVQLANKYQSEIFVEKKEQKVKGKSITGVMTLAAGKGQEITVTAQGKDAEQYIDELTNLIERKFDED